MVGVGLGVGVTVGEGDNVGEGVAVITDEAFRVFHDEELTK
jgi:hypothetical protein